MLFNKMREKKKLRSAENCRSKAVVSTEGEILSIHSQAKVIEQLAPKGSAVS